MTAASLGKQCRIAPVRVPISLGAGIFQLECIWPGPAPRSGQFFLIKPRRSACFLGRPISVAGHEPGPGMSRIIRFLIARRGRGTGELAELRAGDEAELTGPLGNRWEDMEAALPPGTLSGEGSVALVGGGIGIAPLLALSAELAPESYDFYGGFRSAPFGLEGLKPRRLVIASESGAAYEAGALCETSVAAGDPAAGNRRPCRRPCRGRITDFFDPGGYRGVYACGPLPMLKAVAGACAKSHTPCFVSMERPMACGVGACLGCAVATRQGNRRCCTDGPIFPAEELFFDD